MAETHAKEPFAFATIVQIADVRSIKFVPPADPPAAGALGKSCRNPND